MFKERRVFSNYAPRETRVEVANGDAIAGTGHGMVKATHRGSPLTFCNALHVPSLKSDLISMTELAKNGCSINFLDSGKFEVVQDMDVVLSGNIVDGLMELDVDLGKSLDSPTYAMTAQANGHLLHSRLGHPGPVPFSKIFPNSSPPKSCEPCILAKHHQLPYPGKFKLASEKLELLHSDLSGIITPPSLGGSQYYYKITDSHTSYKFVFLLHQKSETLSKFMKFKSFIENQTSLRIKAIVNDNGGEYTSKAFDHFISEHGIRMHLTAPYTPQQNPVAERGNRTTVEKARAMLEHAGLPSEFWAEAVSTAVYLENRTPIASRGFKSPYELWNGAAPSYGHLRVFGCLAYIHIDKGRRQGKFSDTAERGVFLGYQEGHHNYRIMILSTRQIVYSHDVIFNEDCFPLRANHPTFTDSEEVEFNDQPPTDSVPHSPTPDASPAHDASSDNDSSTYLSDENDNSPQSPTESATPLEPLRAPKDISSIINEDNILPSRTRGSARASEKIVRAMNATSPDPTTYLQATQRPDSEEWIDAMERELSALEKMNVWEEVPLPPGEHAIGTTWV